MTDKNKNTLIISTQTIKTTTILVQFLFFGARFTKKSYDKLRRENLG